MIKQHTYIDAGKQDMSRPKERPKKKNWKTEMTKSFLQIYQYAAPAKVAEIIWDHFTKPVEARFTSAHQDIMAKARQQKHTYRGFELVSYIWGSGGKRVLLSHGWNSKIADYRKMILHLTDQGFEVHGIDMKGHGQSEGIRSALPEFRDVLKNYIEEQGKFNALVGYSLGGISAGIALDEVDTTLRPDDFFLIATPPYTRYFFETAVKEEAGCNHQVYQHLCDIVEEHYKENIDYFDLRRKQATLSGLNMHLIYDEMDQTVPFKRGEEMKEYYPKAHWVHTKGLGHYKIIAYKEVIEYIGRNI